MDRAVFLDRDGTLIEETGYLRDPGLIRFIPGSIEAIRLLNENGLKAVVTSNQSGIARGLLTEEELKAVQESLQNRLSEKGAFLDGFYFCPHHPEEGDPPYRQDCSCRKPRPGLIRMAQQDLGVDPAESYTVGDRATDLEAGRGAGTKTILVRTGYGQEESGQMKVLPDHVADDLLDAVHWILAGGRTSKEDHREEGIQTG